METKSYGVHNLVPITGGEELKCNVQGAAKIPEPQTTVVLEIVGGGCVRTDLVFVEGFHSNHSI